MQRISLKTFMLLGGISVLTWSCNHENVSSSSSGQIQSGLLAVGQTSAQLASGSSFSITTSTSSGSNGTPDQNHLGGCPNGGMGSFLDGTNFLTPTNELVVIVDAESAGDMRGIRMYADGGAKITNYDASGNVVTLSPPPMNTGPEGASFSGGQFPKNDSLLAKIVKTEIDFGSDSVITTQIAFPDEITQAVYKTALYSAHGENTLTFASDNVFSDGYANELCSLSGDTTNGYALTHTINVAG